MISFNPDWGGTDIIQDTPPYDGMSLVFLPSIVADVTGSIPQLESESSVHSFMQEQFRTSAENLNDGGLLYYSVV